MMYTALPWEFHPSDYKNCLSSIYGPGVENGSSEKRFIDEILNYVASEWDYVKDKWFYNTAAYLLLTGARISELPTIKTINNIDDVVLKIYCAKQDITRHIKINAAVHNILLNSFFFHGYVVHNEKEFNRRFKKIYPQLHEVAKIKRINEGSHLFRHIHCCTAIYKCGVKRDEITKAFQWANDKMIDSYLALCSPLK